MATDDSPPAPRPGHPPRSSLVARDDEPPFITECQVLFEDGPEGALKDFKKCMKNPGHPTFIPVNDFKLEHLPLVCQTEGVMEYIKKWSERTVKISLYYTSMNRPDTYPDTSAPYPFWEYKGNDRVGRCGSGFVQYKSHLNGIISGKCPCHICKNSDKPMEKYIYVVVKTAAHVLFDGSEAEHAVCELFYNSEEERDNVKRLYGVCLLGGDRNTAEPEDVIQKKKIEEDMVEVLFATHDIELLDLVSCMEDHPTGDYLESCGIIISHPHGLSKHITVGNIDKYKTSLSENTLLQMVKNNHSGNFSYTLNYINLDSDEGDQSQSQSQNSTDDDGESVEVLLAVPFGVEQELPAQTKCRLSDNSQISSTHPFQEFIESSVDSCQLELELEYAFKVPVVLFIPSNASRLCHRKSQKRYWLAIPAGTTITTTTSQDRKDNLVAVPEDLEVEVPDLFWPCFQTYNIDTCIGCSGAPVIGNLENFDRNYLHIPSHSGAVSDGTNRSAVMPKLY